MTLEELYNQIGIFMEHYEDAADRELIHVNIMDASQALSIDLCETYDELIIEFEGDLV